MNNQNSKEVVRVSSPDDAAIVALDEVVEKAAALAVEGDIAAVGRTFRNTLRVANAVSAIKRALTPAVMAPVMELQGTRVGFLTDKIYPEETVKNCLVEAAFKGLAPFGNQINILAGKCYVTKEGMQVMLGRVPGLDKWGFEPSVPAIQGQKAEVMVTIEWIMTGETEKRTESRRFSVRVNAGMGDDAIMGKAERKAAAWLYKRLTGIDAVDGEAGESAPLGRGERNITAEVGVVPERVTPIARARAAAGIQEEATFAPGGEPTGNVAPGWSDAPAGRADF